MAGFYNYNGGQYIADRKIKILGIGNSYTLNSLRWLWKILTELGYTDVIIGHAYWGSSTLEQQYNSLSSSSADHTKYTYYKYTNSQDATTTASYALSDAIEDETWDVVVFQQQSASAGQYQTFVSQSFDINSFVTYVKSHINNPNLRIGLALTWSHSEGSTAELVIQYYNGDTHAMWEAIKTTIPQVADHMTQCDFVVNSGYAVDYARQNTYLNALGDQALHTDKVHLYPCIGKYMVGLVYAMTICNVQIEELTWYPTTEDSNTPTTSAYLAYLARQCAKKAVDTVA